ncbi:MAG: hypothetical protein ACR2H3_02020, partial [Acidimicrobiales bacterium]
MPASTRSTRKAAQPGHRGFRLGVEADSDGRVALRLNETNGRPDHARPVAYLAANRYPKASDAVVKALAASGHQPRALAPTRKKP